MEYLEDLNDRIFGKMTDCVEIKRNEILSLNIIVICMMWKYLTKRTLPEFAREFGLSEKKVQYLRNGNDTRGKLLLNDMAQFCNMLGIEQDTLVGKLLYDTGDIEAIRDLILYKRLVFFINYDKLVNMYYGIERNFAGIIGSDKEEFWKHARMYVPKPGNKVTEKVRGDGRDYLFEKKNILKKSINDRIKKDCDKVEQFSVSESDYRTVISYLKFLGNSLRENNMLDEIMKALENQTFNDLKKIIETEKLQNYRNLLDKQMTFVKTILYLRKG